MYVSDPIFFHPEMSYLFALSIHPYKQKSIYVEELELKHTYIQFINFCNILYICTSIAARDSHCSFSFC